MSLIEFQQFLYIYFDQMVATRHMGREKMSTHSWFNCDTAVYTEREGNAWVDIFSLPIERILLNPTVLELLVYAMSDTLRVQYVDFVLTMFIWWNKYFY